MIIYPLKEEIIFQSKKMIMFLKQKKNPMNKMQVLMMKDGNLIMKMIYLLLRKDVEAEAGVEQEEEVEEEDKAMVMGGNAAADVQRVAKQYYFYQQCTMMQLLKEINKSLR